MEPVHVESSQASGRSSRLDAGSVCAGRLPLWVVDRAGSTRHRWARCVAAPPSKHRSSAKTQWATAAWV
eukprot:14166554-Alexandrium_andersonii.AAC.1